jgi:hypothetical protein
LGVKDSEKNELVKELIQMIQLKPLIVRETTGDQRSSKSVAHSRKSDDIRFHVNFNRHGSNIMIHDQMSGRVSVIFTKFNATLENEIN